MAYLSNGISVVGLADAMAYTVSAFLPEKYGASPYGDAWQIQGNHLLHVGPAFLDQGTGAYGCIAICHSKMGDLNGKLLLYSNAKSGDDLIRSQKFKIQVEGAVSPPLIDVLKIIN